MSVNPRDWLWETKYRPQTLEECILPEQMKSDFKAMVAGGEIKNMILASCNPGTGKTTVAQAICNELDADVLFINASKESGIDVFRNDVTKFASTISMMSNCKVIILDEADNLSDAAQKAFRGIIEEFSVSCRFILTCNYVNQIIEPIRSRMMQYEFSIPQAEKATMMKGQIMRCLDILAKEGITVESKMAVAELVKRKFPDNRAMLVTLQTYSMKGVIDEGILGRVTSGSDVEVMIGHLKAKKFNEIRALVPKFASDYPTFIRAIYDTLYTLAKPASIPTMIEIIGMNQEAYSRVPDIEIHMNWLMVQLMTNVEFV
jgi:DNA polymerase III delta prime subunit